MADLDTLSAAEAACFPAAEAASRASIRARLETYPRHVWLLEDGGTIVSFVHGMTTDARDLTDEMYENAALHREDGAWQMIFSVGTIPACRGRGLAARLLRRAIEDARTQGRRGLVLTCKEALIPFYASLGFENEGVSQSVHGGVVWYQMRLTF